MAQKTVVKNNRGNGTGKHQTSGIQKIIGKKGLRNIGGRIDEEYMTTMKSWDKESKIYIEMSDDVTVGTLLDSIKLPILSAPFDVEAGGTESADEEAKDFLWKNMHGMHNQTWRSFIWDRLTALEFGFDVGEFQLEKKEDGRMWLRNVHPRGQETLYKWGFDENDDAIEFYQRDFKSGDIEPLPLSKCIHVTFRGRKGNPQGRSLLRSLYRPWRFLKDLENLEAIGIERDVGGMPVASLPEEGEISSDDEDNVKEALEALRTDEAMYLILPGGMTVQPYGGGSKMYDVKVVIDRYQKIILMRMFAQFLTLGMGQVGTQALVQGSQDFFSLGLKAVQEDIIEALNQQLVPFLFRYNLFPIKELPTITWKEAGKVDVSAILNAYSVGVSSGALTSVKEDEEHFRTIMELPELPEGEGEGIRIPEQPASPEIWEIKDSVKALSNEYRQIAAKISQLELST